MRRVATPNEFFDILDKIGNGKFVTIGCVMGSNLEDVPTIKRKNPLTNRLKGYPDHTAFGMDEEIGALVMIKSYNMRYSPRKIVAQKYGEYKKSANDIRAKFGIDPIGTKQGYKQTMNYGENGQEVYNGNNEKLQNHSYNPQNIFGVKPICTYYCVNQEGHIIKELSKNDIAPYMKHKNSIDGVVALQKMQTKEEDINDYIAQINNLKFRYINFEANSILWIAATVNGEKIVYINDNLNRAINGININPEDFKKIARERYQIDMNNLKEEKINNKKQIIKLTESDLHQIIKESVNKILTELGGN